MINSIFIFTIILAILLLKICEKNKILVDFKKENHKRFTSKITNYSIGGVIFYLFWLLIYISDKNFASFFFQSFSLIFLVGLFSDLKIFKSAGLRFLLQIITLLYFVFISNFEIPLSNIHSIDIFLNNYYFNKFFTIFCLMILVNGNNFIDGINTLLLGYNIVLGLFLLFFFESFLHNYTILENYIYILLILMLFNIKGKIILGDAGAYALAFFMGVYLIDFSRNNPYLSPFFIISLLWYPCFELLFSIIRRLKFNKKTYEPDTKHLHQILYMYILNNVKNNHYAHILVSLIINGYFFISLYLNYITNYKSSIICLFVLFNVSLYLLIYKFLNKK